MFRHLMDKRNWFHPCDENGTCCAFADIPEHIGKPLDDPYRSLSGK